MSTEAEELSFELFNADNHNQSREHNAEDWAMLNADKYRPSIEPYKLMAAAILAAGYRKIFDGDCGLSGINDPTDREAAEAWMRWANIVNTGGGEPNGIAAMKQMLTELGYRKHNTTPEATR